VQLLKNRFLAISCVIAVSIMALSIYIPPELSIAVIAISVVGAVICSVIAAVIYARGIMRQQRIKDIFLYFTVTLLLIAILMSSGYGYFQNDLAIARKYDQCEVTVKGIAEKMRYDYSYSSALEVKITEINGESADIKAILEFEGGSPLEEYDLFILSGTAALPDENEAYLVSDGFVMKISASLWKVDTVGRADVPWYSVFRRISDVLQNVLERKTEPETAGLVGAMVLGNRGELGNKVTRDFSRVGISHMLALSGLHVTIVIGAFDLILKRMEMEKSLRCIFLVLASLLYLGITGLSLSAARAVIMICSVYVAHVLWTDSDSITALFVSAVIIFAVSPAAILDVGYWMSFLATLGIILAVKILSPLHYKLKKKPLYVQSAVNLLTAASVTVAANVAVSAFLWLVFGEISIISVISNLIFSIPATLIIMLGIALLTFSWVPLISDVIVLLLNTLSGLFYTVTAALSEWRGILISLNYGFVKYVIPPMLAVLLFFALIKLRRKWIMALPALAAVIAFSVCLTVYNVSNRGVSEVTYIKSNKNEMITVVNTKQASICDISSGGFANFKVAYDAVTYQCAAEIENFILTHYHQYHPNALRRICESYMVRNVYLPKPRSENDKKWYDSIMLSFEKSQTAVKLYEPGEDIDIGDGGTLNVSEYYYIDRSVHPVYTVRVTNNGESLLYMSSSIYENKAFEENYTGAEHLIFGIHGPNIHSNPDFSIYDIEKAETVILADGERWSDTGDRAGSGLVTMEKDGIYSVTLDGK